MAVESRLLQGDKSEGVGGKPPVGAARQTPLVADGSLQIPSRPLAPTPPDRFLDDDTTVEMAPQPVVFLLRWR